MEDSLISNYFKYKKAQQQNNGEEEVNQDGKRPIMKGTNEKRREFKKGVNVMGNMQNGVNMSRFQEMLNKLKEQSDTPVKNLTDESLKHYKEVEKTMSISTGSPNYNILSNLISTTFNGERTFPSTVGGVLAGCHTQFKDANIVEEGCTPSCAGSFKGTNESKVCTHKVYISEPNGKGAYKMQNIFNPEETTNAYIYIPRSKDRKFHKPLFDIKTLEVLSKDGVQNVNIIGYDALSNILVRVFPEDDSFIPLQSLYPKKVKPPNQLVRGGDGLSGARSLPNPREGNGGVSQWDIKTIIIVALIFIAIIGYIFLNK